MRDINYGGIDHMLELDYLEKELRDPKHKEKNWKYGKPYRQYIIEHKNDFDEYGPDGFSRNDIINKIIEMSFEQKLDSLAMFEEKHLRRSPNGDLKDILLLLEYNRDEEYGKKLLGKDLRKEYINELNKLDPEHEEPWSYKDNIFRLQGFVYKERRIDKDWNKTLKRHQLYKALYWIGLPYWFAGSLTVPFTAGFIHSLITSPHQSMLYHLVTGGGCIMLACSFIAPVTEVLAFLYTFLVRPFILKKLLFSKKVPYNDNVMRCLGMSRKREREYTGFAAVGTCLGKLFSKNK